MINDMYNPDKGLGLYTRENDKALTRTLSSFVSGQALSQNTLEDLRSSGECVEVQSKTMNLFAIGADSNGKNSHYQDSFELDLGKNINSLCVLRSLDRQPGNNGRSIRQFNAVLLNNINSSRRYLIDIYNLCKQESNYFTLAREIQTTIFSTANYLKQSQNFNTSQTIETGSLITSLKLPTGNTLYMIAQFGNDSKFPYFGIERNSLSQSLFSEIRLRQVGFTAHARAVMNSTNDYIAIDFRKENFYMPTWIQVGEVNPNMGGSVIIRGGTSGVIINKERIYKGDPTKSATAISLSIK